MPLLLSLPGWQLLQMARFRPHIFFVLIMLIYFFTRYLRSTSPELPDFFRYHFTDLLFVPAMGLFALIFVRLLKRDHNITIPGVYVLIQVVFVSLFFEWYLPNYSAQHSTYGWYTSDYVDCIMYSLGGGIFLLIQRFSL